MDLETIQIPRSSHYFALLYYYLLPTVQRHYTIIILILNNGEARLRRLQTSSEKFTINFVLLTL